MLTCKLLGTPAATGTILQCIGDYMDARTPGPIVTYSPLPIVHALHQRQANGGGQSWVGNGECQDANDFFSVVANALAEDVVQGVTPGDSAARVSRLAGHFVTTGRIYCSPGCEVGEASFHDIPTRETSLYIGGPENGCGDVQCVQQLLNAAFDFKLDTYCSQCKSDHRREINVPELPKMLRLRLAHGCVPRLKEVVSLAAAAPLCDPAHAYTLRSVIVLVNASHYVAVSLCPVTKLWYLHDDTQVTPCSSPWEIGFWDAIMWRGRDATPTYILYELVQPWSLHPCILPHTATNLDTSVAVPATMGHLFVSCCSFSLPALIDQFVASRIRHFQGQCKTQVA